MHHASAFADGPSERLRSLYAGKESKARAVPCEIDPHIGRALREALQFLRRSYHSRLQDMPRLD